MLPEMRREKAARELPLEDAISEIEQACEGREPGDSPFFIIAGAGVSAPSVPLASQIIEECKKKAAEYNRGAEPAPGTTMATYSYWLGRAYPQSIQRQEYFKELIKDKPISHANFRLAHLLGERRLATLVVTPNFDDFLSRALTLFGDAHIVCDHPNTVERINPESNEIQIVHVHGTYWFYDCCNLWGEIEDRTEDTRERSATMVSLLDNIVSRRSAIVIGYSGWEGDVIMTALERRLTSGLPYNLYWFCHRRNALDVVPSFLRRHRDVCFVLPSFYSEEPVPVVGLDSKLPPLPKDAEPVLTAQSTLDKLVRAFTRGAPALTLNPIGFLADQLLKSFPPDFPEKTEEDIYDLRDVIRRLERVRKTGAEKVSPIEHRIELVRDAVRRSAYREALEIIDSIDLQLVELEQCKVLMDLTLSAAFGLDDDSDEELAAYDTVLQLGNRHDLDDPEGLLSRERVAMAFFNKALILRRLGRNDDAVKTLDSLVQRFGDATETTLREQVAAALLSLGNILRKIGRNDESVRAYDEVARQFKDATEVAFRERVARALTGKGLTLGDMGRSEDEVALYDEVERRFGDAVDLQLRDAVARALFNKSFVQYETGDTEGAERTIDDIIRRYDNAPEPALREAVARALVSRGIARGGSKHSEEEVAAYNEVIRRFGDASELGVRVQVARALLGKGFALVRLNRAEEGIQANDALLQRFGDTDELPLGEYVAKSLVNKGAALANLKRYGDAIQNYDLVLARFSDAPEPEFREQVGMAIFNKGVALANLDRKEEAVQTYDQLVKRFGGASEFEARDQVAKALANKGVALGALNRPEEEVQTYDLLLQLFGNATEPALHEQVARAHVYKGITLAQLNRHQDARRSFEEVLARFVDSPAPAVQLLVGRARTFLEPSEDDEAKT
jgi:tetratricopeptide (TPR) repeat protein